MLLDTSIVIDVLRQRPQAVSWLSGLTDRPSLSVVTIVELRAGAKGRAESAHIGAILAHSTLFPVDAALAEAAGALSFRYRKSHALEAIDAIIAATAQVHDLSLATLNVKHFPMFPALARPY